LNAIEHLISRAETLITKLEALLPNPTQAPNWNALAWRWTKTSQVGHLQAVLQPHIIALDDILYVETQKTEIVRNTKQFLQGLPANHVLLTGARGTGKSSLIKALLQTYANQGLRLIEVEKQDLIDLPTIVDLISQRTEKFIIFCDDLTFEANDVSYKALKVILDGSIANTPNNLLVYATSNRKNLMPEFMADNLPIMDTSGEIRPNDTIDEKTALAERFGLWLSFYSMDQDTYIAIAKHWLSTFNVAFDVAAEEAALHYYHMRGARSGRIAFQFAKDYAGKLHVK
jgi:uncharacterized protein